jgi:hypothetical protein
MSPRQRRIPERIPVKTTIIGTIALVHLTTYARTTNAQPNEVVTTPVATPAPPAPPPPYSLPWQLRPVTVATALRSDTSFAFYETAAGDRGSTVASTFLFAYRLTPTLAPLVRVGVVQNAEPGGGVGNGVAFVNPIVGLTYGRRFGGSVRAASFLGTSLPVGMGGDKPSAQDATAAAVSRGIAARAAMDNAMFAVNYATAIAGVDVAYVAHRLTVQAEATLLQLFRTRHAQLAPESTRTNFTAGLHVGVFALSFLSLGGEVRHQRWLSTPKSVAANPATRDTTTLAVGPRFHFKAGNAWLRPGLSYAAGIDAPLSALTYHIVQLDLPVVF